MTPLELERYDRHLRLPNVGREGQMRLTEASVVIIGAGGLGSPLALYLAAAGIGRIGLVEYDTVDRSNLQRQILYDTADTGRPKIEAAAERIRGINPHVQVDLHPTRLTRENALSILDAYDVVADGTDNFATRYLVNDACVLLGKPNVYGSIFRFEGQVSVFGLSDGPCYRCLFDQPPPPHLVPSCAEGGVLGVLPGLVGSIQATEVLKLILGIGDSLAGRLLLVDALSMHFRSVEVPKDPLCPVCGTHPTVTELIDYEAFCGLPVETSSVPSLSPHALFERLDAGATPVILDVRTPVEYARGHLGGRLIPLHELPERLGELETVRNADLIVVHCQSGVRSAEAVRLLSEAGFSNAVNLEGGLNAWNAELAHSAGTPGDA